MSSHVQSDCTRGLPAAPEAGSEGALHAHLNGLVVEREALEGELLRCHEQLNLVFDITEYVSGLQDPGVVEGALLQRYGAMLRAGTVFMDHGGCCMRVELSGGRGRQLELAPQRVRAVLAEHVETVRLTCRAAVVPLTREQVAALGGARVLLGALRKVGSDPAVVVALRDGREPPFDASDILASESILAYGAQIMRNASVVRDLRRSAVETVYAFVNAIDAKDNYTSDHSERVGGLARLAGEALGLPNERLLVLEWAGLLHDVGKIGVREQILNKPGQLTEAEFAEVKNHPRIGYDMLRPVAHFGPILDAVLYHHENYDGSGYPEGLRGEQIPLDARVIHVVDIFDALTTDRPYRGQYDVERAFELLLKDAGRVTDPQVTPLFVEALRHQMLNHPDVFCARLAYLAPGRPGAQVRSGGE